MNKTPRISKSEIKIKCPDCGANLEQDSIHLLCLRCSNPNCDYWCGLHPPSERRQETPLEEE